MDAVPLQRRAAVLLAILAVALAPCLAQEEMPLPEHPRPDFMRPEWVNLNGNWAFQFDADDAGLDQGWQAPEKAFTGTISVPFPWGSPLSGVEDEAPIGWYRRSITIPADWTEGKPFLVIGAADWHTTAWLDGQELGTHQGGYTPFAFDLSEQARPGQAQELVIRVDDVDRAFTLEGKQGYGDARGIWQTVYLERRGQTFLNRASISPNLENNTARMDLELNEVPAAALDLTVTLQTPEGERSYRERVPAGSATHTLVLDIEAPRRWTLDDPYLYEVGLRLGSEPAGDEVHTYFGMRSVSVVDLPGTDYRYVALNGEPVYLQMALDQAYHPEGFYTFPSDDFIRDEVLRSRQIGLNGMRVHVKIALPRKLYWADRLGMLIMADVPNSWGQPDADMRSEIEYALRQMIRRDFNHPSIFSWVIFNETWGLFTDGAGPDGARAYLPETQAWVVEMVQLARSLDPTRLVEDNSPCCGIGHTDTDLNTWHSYLPGWAWEDQLARIDSGTFAGSTWNMEEGYVQDRQPNINSEFGNVWGYQGSTGDVDWSWDYHRALNAFRRYPRIAGWLYTEHHDVVNEWNGYWKYDRSPKYTGMDDLAPGMDLRDLHAPFYLSPGVELSQAAATGSRQEVPLYASFLSGRDDLGPALTLRWDLLFHDERGGEATLPGGSRSLAYQPWMCGWLEQPIAVDMPDEPGLLVLRWQLEDAAGGILHRNFITYLVEGEPDPRPGEHRLRFAPDSFVDQSWSRKQWNVLEGRKVNGAGAGYFEYRIPWPEGLDPEAVDLGSLLLEASSKPLLGKDREDGDQDSGDYMRGGGLQDPSQNPNAYPMTDDRRNPSLLRLSMNGTLLGAVDLPDDPADHRGVLSWHSQWRDRRLREAGTYGYRISLPIPRNALRAARDSGELRLRLEVPEALPGGLALYGKASGRYPFDPTILLIEKP